MLPLTVRVNPAAPAVALVGARVVVSGRGLLIVKVSGADSPPPGSGSKTVTAKLPAVAISVASTIVLNWAASMNVVVLSMPLMRMMKVLRKLLPCATRVKLGPPTTALAGASPLTVGGPMPLMAGPNLKVLPIRGLVGASLPTGL